MMKRGSRVAVAHGPSAKQTGPDGTWKAPRCPAARLPGYLLVDMVGERKGRNEVRLVMCSWTSLIRCGVNCFSRLISIEVADQLTGSIQTARY